MQCDNFDFKFRKVIEKNPMSPAPMSRETMVAYLILYLRKIFEKNINTFKG